MEWSKCEEIKQKSSIIRSQWQRVDEESISGNFLEFVRVVDLY